MASASPAAIGVLTSGGDAPGMNAAAAVCIGLQGGRIFSSEDMPRMADAVRLRPKEQWWLELQSITLLPGQFGEERSR